MLLVRGLETCYGRIQVLRGVTLSVNPGEIVAIIGANGAGKSTFLNTVAGLHPPLAGEVLLEGRPVHGLPAEEVVRRGISLVPERRQVFDALSVADNLLLGAYHRYRRSGKELSGDIARIFEVFPFLRGKERRLAGTLSGGEQQMLAIGRGLMARPKLLLLDEPSLGLAPLVVREILRILVELKRNGTTILLVEQNARAALRVADRVCVMERGRIVLQGTADELLRDVRVQHAYLGRGYHAGEDNDSRTAGHEAVSGGGAG